MPSMKFDVARTGGEGAKTGSASGNGASARSSGAFALGARASAPAAPSAPGAARGLRGGVVHETSVTERHCRTDRRRAAGCENPGHGTLLPSSSTSPAAAPWSSPARIALRSSTASSRTTSRSSRRAPAARRPSSRRRESSSPTASSCARRTGSKSTASRSSRRRSKTCFGNIWFSTRSRSGIAHRRRPSFTSSIRRRETRSKSCLER